MLIGGLQKSSLIDYPEKISAIVFTQGCNFRCPYCHNPELMTGNIDNGKSGMKFDSDSVIEFLKTRVGKLDGVVITGGEPTLQKDLPEFVREIKSLGFSIKLDTNGTNVDVLKMLIDEELIDYVAMDIKAPIEKYSEVVSSQVNKEHILKSIELVKNSGLNYEFRTTVVKSQLSVDDFEQIGGMISGAKRYYLQKFVPTKTLDESFMTETTYSDAEFDEIIKALQKQIKNVLIR